MEANNLFEEIFGWMAGILTFIFFIIVSKPFINLSRGKISLEETPGFYIALNYVNSLCWYIYGDFLYNDCIKKVYFLGCIISFILYFIYLFHEAEKYKKEAIINGIIIISITYIIYIGLTILIGDVDIIAKFCFASNSILFFYLIPRMYYAIKDKNYTLIPFNRACCSLLTGLCWAIYGYEIDEYYVFLINIIAIIISMIEIFLYLKYKRKYFSINVQNKQKVIRKEENGNKIDEEVQFTLSERPVNIIEKV